LVLTDANIAAVQAAVTENIQQSMRQLAKNHNMDPRTMRSLVKDDLGMESRVIVQRRLIIPNVQEIRKEEVAENPQEAEKL
jgi:hypothetical protein